MKIIPSLLTSDINEFVLQAEKLVPYYQHFQVDIADGEFVPGKTINLSEIAISLPRIKNFSSLIFDFDLLVKDVSSTMSEIEELRKQVGVDKIFFHNLDAFSPRPNVGIAIDPPLSVDTIKQRFDLVTVPVIQIMSVPPGAQGRAFMPETLQKIEQLRKAGYRNNVYLDGGINEKSIPQILEKQYRPDVLCIGSYLTKAENIKERVSQLSSSTGILGQK